MWNRCEHGWSCHTTEKSRSLMASEMDGWWMDGWKMAILRSGEVGTGLVRRDRDTDFDVTRQMPKTPEQLHPKENLAYLFIYLFCGKHECHECFIKFHCCYLYETMFCKFTEIHFNSFRHVDAWATVSFSPHHSDRKARTGWMVVGIKCWSEMTHNRPVI